MSGDLPQRGTHERSRALRKDATPGRRERKHPLDYAIALLLLATAVGTGFAAWYTAKQWGTARDTLVVSQRAFVTVGNINVIVSVGDDQKLNYLNVDIRFRIAVTLAPETCKFCLNVEHLHKIL